MSDSEAVGARLSRWLGLLGALSLFALAVTVVRTPGAAGYEPSIYAGYPTYFWVLVVGTILVGQLLIIRGALRVNPAESNWWLGFLLAGVTIAVIVFVPFFRRYPVYGRGDVLTHIGYVHDIQATGGDPFQNIYQNIHQTVLALSYATGLRPMRVINAVSGVIAVFSIGASYALLITVFDRRRALLTLPFLLTLIAGSGYMNPSPYPQSVLLFPFVLYLFVKTQRADSFGLRLALTVAVIGVLLYHPLTAVFLILIFLVHYAVVSGADSEGTRRPFELSRVTSANVMQLSLAVFLAWYSNFVGIILRFETVYNRVLRPGQSETELDNYSSTVSEFSPSLIDLAGVGLVRFGLTAVLLGIGTVTAIWLLRRYQQGQRVTSSYLVTFSLGFIVFVCFGVLFMIVNLIGSFGRPLMFAEYFAALGAGALLYRVYDYFNWKPRVTVAVVILLAAMVVVGLVTVYAAPFGGKSNHQVTAQDLDGAQWYFEQELETEPLQEQGIRMYRLEHVFNGSESWNVQKEGTLPPDRFNYTEYSTLGASYEEDQYYVLTERGRVFYPTVYPSYEDQWRFKPVDYARLAVDPTISKLYDNGEFEVSRIDAQNRTAAP